MANPKTAPSQIFPPNQFTLVKFWLPLIILIGTIVILDQTGYIHIFGNSNPAIYEFPEDAIVGVPWSYDFAPELIPLLPPESTGGPYTFYLGSGVGFHPMNLSLGIDGILSGTPTGKGSKFEVCVKDVGGRSACRIYQLDVSPAGVDEQKGNAIQNNCLPEPKCEGDPNCITTETNVCAVPLVVVVHANCKCPAHTKEGDEEGDVFFNPADGITYKNCYCGY